MGLESQQQQLNTNIPLVGEINTNASSQAVKDMQAALKDGFITSDEILERMSQRRALKKTLEEKQLKNQIAEQDATSNLIQPRADLAAAQTKANLDIFPTQAAAAKKSAELQLSGLNFTEKLMPLAQQTAEYQQYQALQAAATGGDSTALSAAANQSGIPVQRDEKTGQITNLDEIRQKVANQANFAKFSALQKAFRESTENITSESQEGGQVVKKLTTYWKGTTIPVPDNVQSFFGGIVPGMATVAGTTPSASTPAAATPSTTTPSTTPAGGSTDLIQPKTNTTPVSIQPVGSATPTTTITPTVGARTSGGVVTSVMPVKASETKDERTQAQDLATAQSTLTAIQNARQTVATPGVVGPMAGSSPVQTANQVAAAFGIRNSEFTSQRELEILINKKVLEGAQQMKGNLSDRDVLFLKKSVPKLSDTPELWNKFLSTWEGMTKKNIEVLQGKAPSGASVLDTASSTATPAATAPASLSAVPTVTSASQVPQGATVVRTPDGKLWMK